MRKIFLFSVICFLLCTQTACDQNPENKLKELQKADLMARERALDAAKAKPSASIAPIASATLSADQDKNGTYKLISEIALAAKENEAASPSPSVSPSPSAPDISLAQVLSELEKEEIKEKEAERVEFSDTATEQDNNHAVTINSAETRRGPNNGLLGGVVTRSTPSKSASNDSENDDTNDTSAVPSPSLAPLLEGPARGYTLLYLMQPNARQAVERQLQTLIDARIKNVYIGVLTDGTFGKDFEYLGLVLRKFVGADRNVTLELYLTNGATMREFETTEINAGFNRIDPIKFRDLIRHDQNTRGRFLNMLREVKPIFDLNRRLHPRNRNIATMMLEDNLDQDSYSAMRELARSVLADEVIYMRNPCLGCYEGNDDESLGDGIESHDVNSLGVLSSQDGISLDGTGFSLQPSGSELSFGQVGELLRIAAQRNLRFVGLWKVERQGRTLSSEAKPPSEREFEVASDDEMEREAELLRAGL